MKKELGDWTRRFFLCLSFSSSAGGLSRSMSFWSTCNESPRNHHEQHKIGRAINQAEKRDRNGKEKTNNTVESNSVPSWRCGRRLERSCNRREGARAKASARARWRRGERGARAGDGRVDVLYDKVVNLRRPFGCRLISAVRALSRFCRPLPPSHATPKSKSDFVKIP